MDLNLRDVDPAMVARLKREAFEQGKTLKELCLDGLNMLVREMPAMPEKAAVREEPVAETVKKPERVKKVKAVEPDPVTVALELAASGGDEPVGSGVVASVVESRVPVVASNKAPAEAASGCRKHPGAGWAKSGGWWCPPCGKVV